jgi:hypothetical protein
MANRRLDKKNLAVVLLDVLLFYAPWFDSLIKIAELVCSTGGFDGMVTVSCESNNPLVSPQVCTSLPLGIFVFCKFE